MVVHESLIFAGVVVPAVSGGPYFRWSLDAEFLESVDHETPILDGFRVAVVLRPLIFDGVIVME